MVHGRDREQRWLAQRDVQGKAVSSDRTAKRRGGAAIQNASCPCRYLICVQSLEGWERKTIEGLANLKTYLLGLVSFDDRPQFGKVVDAARRRVVTGTAVFDIIKKQWG
ncbi:MAG: hypothetical protein AAF471_01250 [Myxococcota bacterium]